MVNCHNIFFSNANTYFFLAILIEIFILKTTMYHKYNLHNKNTKKKLKTAATVYALHFALNIGGIFAQSLRYYVSFVFPANLI
jgi:uncharacterized membrane protein